jgi:hypothetical protein
VIPRKEEKEVLPIIENSPATSERIDSQDVNRITQDKRYSREQHSLMQQKMLQTKVEEENTYLPSKRKHPRQTMDSRGRN